MKTSRYTDSQIMAILKQAEAGTPVPQLCREHGMTRQHITLIHTQPGNSQKNVYVERYNRTVRYDWLAQNLCGSLVEV